MAFKYVNRKGVTYWLHKKGRLYYFSKKPTGAVDLPNKFEVFENERTGLPMVRKKK